MSEIKQEPESNKKSPKKYIIIGAIIIIIGGLSIFGKIQYDTKSNIINGVNLNTYNKNTEKFDYDKTLNLNKNINVEKDVLPDLPYFIFNQSQANIKQSASLVLIKKINKMMVPKNMEESAVPFEYPKDVSSMSTKDLNKNPYSEYGKIKNAYIEKLTKKYNLTNCSNVSNIFVMKNNSNNTYYSKELVTFIDKNTNAITGIGVYDTEFNYKDNKLSYGKMTFTKKYNNDYNKIYKEAFDKYTAMYKNIQAVTQTIYAKYPDRAFDASVKDTSTLKINIIDNKNLKIDKVIKLNVKDITISEIKTS